MSEPFDTGLRVEQALDTLFTGPNPEPGFVAELERQLVLRAQTSREPAGLPPRPFRTGWLPSFRRHRWLVTAAGLVLVAAVALAVLGPQRALAAIQHLLGYVPGIGFVDLEATRLLAAPMEMTQEGVTLRVEQAIARPDRTEIVIRSEGLPPEDQLWPNGAREGQDYCPLLHLPDGSALGTKGWSLQLGGGTLEFPPLPGDVYQVTLELARLPLVPPGAAPESWVVPLILRPATGELVAKIFPQPYAPSGAEDSHHGITLRVLQVAHSPEETVLQLQVEWLDPDLIRPILSGPSLPRLSDDLGHVYWQAPGSSSGSSISTEVILVPAPSAATPTPAGSAFTFEHTMAFSPVSPSAGELTFSVDAIDYGVPVEESFVVDLGDARQVGDHWPLDVHLSVADFPVHITGAQWIEEEMGTLAGPRHEVQLVFDVAPVPTQDGRDLHGLLLEAQAAGFNGGGGGYDPQSGRFSTHLDLGEALPLPTGPIQVRVREANIVFNGPWSVTWVVPGTDRTGKQRLAPVTLHPQGASQMRAGVPLGVQQVVRTDRLTAVTVALDDPPPGIALSRILVSNPAGQGRDLCLEDDRGSRYELGQGVTWRPSDESISNLWSTPLLSQTLSFEPLQPLARRATLHVPAVELYLEGHLSFDLIVPEGMELKPQPDRPWTASQPWQVDIPLEMAGYHLRLSQAQLEGINHSTSLQLIPSMPENGATSPRLTGLRPISITAPDGHALDLAYASRFDYTGTRFDLADPETGQALPGNYHFELEGLTVAVPGPWALSWTLNEP